MQGGKARSAPAEAAAQAAVAAQAVELLRDGAAALIGPGTTTRAVMAALGLAEVGARRGRRAGRRLLAADADEETLLGLAGPESLVIVTPVGGRASCSAAGTSSSRRRCCGAIGVDRLHIVATEAKLAALGGRPLLVDTGDPELDAALAGYRRVVTGYRHETVYRVTA